MINSAKVEIDYLEVTKQDHSPFLETPPEITTGTTAGVTFNSADTIKPRKPATPFTGLAR